MNCQNSNKEEVEPVTECSSFESIDSFLTRNRYRVLDYSILEEYRGISDSLNTKGFINFYETRQNREKSILDTIALLAGLEVFEKYVEVSPDTEILRLSKITGAFGKNEVLVVDGKYTMGEYALIEKYRFRVNEDCTHLWIKAISQNLSNQCFEFVSVDRDSVLLDRWNEVRELMIRTDFWSTDYSRNEASLFICDGPVYHLQASRGRSVLEKSKNLSKECPGDQTAIFLIAEKLISFIK